MRKALIFLSSFVVSFMVIYMVYYYSNVNRYDRGFTAVADSLSNTVFAANLGNFPENKTLVYTAGLQQSLICKGNCKTVTDSLPVPLLYTVGMLGQYSRNAVDLLNNEILARFSKHPPMVMQNVNEGDSVLFSYVFRQILFPENFIESNEGMQIGEKTVRNLRSRPAMQAKDSLRPYTMHRKLSGNSYMLRFVLDGGRDYAYWISSEDSFQNWQQVQHQIKLLENEPAYTFVKEDEIQLPVLDLYLVRYITDIGNLPKFSGTKYMNFSKIEDHLKFKTTGTNISSSLEKTVFGGVRNKIVFGEGSIFILKRTTASQPYIMVLVNNDEILIGRR